MITDIFLGLNVNDYTEQKGKLTYLSWANAWKEVIKVCPSASYKIKINEQNGLPVFGSKEFGYMVYTTVTVENVTHEMWLPVMNNYNKAITDPSTTDINKAVMRCLTKNLAMFGLGLYIYSGEDLPEDIDTKDVTAEELLKLVKEANYEGDLIEGYNKNHEDNKIKELSEMPQENMRIAKNWLLGKIK